MTVVRLLRFEPGSLVLACDEGAQQMGTDPDAAGSHSKNIRCGIKKGY